MEGNDKGSEARQEKAEALRLELGAEAVELRHLVSAASTFAALVNEVSRALTKDEDAVVWTVAVESGSVVLPVVPHAGPDLTADLLRVIPEGIAMIEKAAKRPPHFTDQALTQAQHLANLSSDEMPVRIQNGGAPIKLTKQLVAHVDVLTSEAQPRIGSIEGLLEEVNVHRQPSFQVWERLTGTKVHCRAGSAITTDDLSAALGKRVEVRGRIRQSKTGQKTTIDVKQLRVFAAEEDLPSPDDVRGILAS